MVSISLYSVPAHDNTPSTLMMKIIPTFAVSTRVPYEPIVGTDEGQLFLGCLNHYTSKPCLKHCSVYERETLTVLPQILPARSDLMSNTVMRK